MQDDNSSESSRTSSTDPHEREPSDRDRMRGERREERWSYRDCGRGSRERYRRKGRVLHTRISEELSEDIRRLARDLRVPASNLVRNVLEEVFSVVESVSEDVGQLFEDVVDEAEGARDRIHQRVRRHRRHRRRRRFDDDDLERELREDERAEEPSEAGGGSGSSYEDVLGWQPLVMNREGACAGCGTRLERGSRAFLGITEESSRRITICPACAPQAEGA